MVRSKEQDATLLPSGLRAMPSTSPPCPASCMMGASRLEVRLMPCGARREKAVVRTAVRCCCSQITQAGRGLLTSLVTEPMTRAPSSIL